MIRKLLRIFRESFSPLSIRNFRIYLSGQAVSLIGTWLQMTAQGWVVWELSKNELALGFVGMLSTLPILLLGPIAGVWADRLDRRRLLIGSQAVMMVLAFILAFLVQTGLVQLLHVYILATLLGIVTAVDMPAQQAFLGDLSGVQHVRKAVNLNAMIIQVSRMVGPAFAGYLIGRLGLAPAFWLNGLSFAAVIASLVAVKASQMQMRGGQQGSFMDGLRYLRTQPRLVDLIVFVVLLTFFGLPIIQVLLPAVASDVLHGNEQTYGLLLAASGAGALVSVLFFVPIVQTLKRPGIIVSIAVLWMGVWFALFSFMTWEVLAMFAIFMGSIGAPITFTMALGLIQVLAPVEMRARLLSVFTMVNFGMQPLASLLIGFSASIFGTEMAIRMNGLLMVVGALSIILLRPELRVWEIAPQPISHTVEAPAGAD